MNTRIIEDEKKGKDDNIIKQMRQQCIPKSSESECPRNEEIFTQDLGDSSIST